jgi:sec-independent protein translocase protein TatB
MFDIGWSELVVIGVVALIAIGPKELPGVLRSLGHWMGKVRRMASDFQDQFREAMREAEVADLKRQFDEASEKATSTFNNPLETAQKEVEAAFSPESPAAAEPLANPVATTDPGAIEPPVEPAIAAPETQVSVAPEVPVAPAEPAVDTKPGHSA